MQTVCPTCKGQGEIIPAKDRCTVCKGEKIIPTDKNLEVVIEKGARHATKLVFRGEGDAQPGMTPGDVVIVIQELPHEKFKRGDLIC